MRMGAPIFFFFPWTDRALFRCLAVDRAQKIGKFATASRFSMNQFALCEATPAQVQINEQQYVKSGRTVTRPKRQQSATSPTSLAPPSSSKGGLGLQGEAKPSLLSGKTFVEPSGTNGALSSAATTAVSPGMGTSANVQMSTSTQHYIRVRILTDHEVKHTTTVEILPKMLVSGVINYICNKRRMNPSEWMLVVEDSILPLDGAAEDISSTTELSLVHKSNGKEELFRKAILLVPPPLLPFCVPATVFLITTSHSSPLFCGEWFFFFFCRSKLYFETRSPRDGRNSGLKCVISHLHRGLQRVHAQPKAPRRLCRTS